LHGTVRKLPIVKTRQIQTTIEVQPEGWPDAAALAALRAW
jgi:hypothetical protein